MLPPGHIAAGYLAAEALIKIAHPQLLPSQTSELLWLGALIGFAPDLDYFFVFYKARSFKTSDEKVNHRKLLSHAPLLWLTAGLLIYSLFSSPLAKMTGLLVWLASWSHFALDSLEYGIMWLWPFSSRIFALSKNLDVPHEPAKKPDNSFIAYWWQNVKYYSRDRSFYLEIIILIVAIYNLFRLH